ncbi:MAG: hypothetical protein COA57_13810 [Flavobacteriales bacterium]|nr:MAG: hypothetical protein COA57_13810 [Flavobacteriales bacterium]
MKSKKTLIENIKAKLSHFTREYEIWQFGSSLKSKSYTDVDIGVVVKLPDSRMCEITETLKSIRNAKVVLPADYKKQKDSCYHIVVVSKRQLSRLPIGESIKRGRIVYKSAA